MLRIKKDMLHKAGLFCLLVCVPLSWATFLVGSVYRMVIIITLGLFLIACGLQIVIPVVHQKLAIVWSVFIGYILASTCWAENFNSSFTTNIGMLLIYLVAIMFIAYSGNGYKDNWQDTAWIIAGAVCSLLFLTVGRGELGQYTSRTSLIILGTETDPNEFGGTLLVPISLGAVCAFRERSFWKKTLHLVLILVEVYVILLTGSRGALLATIVAVTVSFLSFFEAKPKTFLTTCLIVAIAIIVVVNVILPVIPEDIIERLSWISIQEDRGTERIDIWEQSLRQLKEGSLLQLLFGYGENPESFRYLFGEYRAMHNQFLQFAVNYGLIGLVLYIWLLWTSFQAIMKNNRRYVGAMAGMVVLSLTISMLSYYKPLWLVLLSGCVFQNDDNRISCEVKS